MANAPPVKNPSLTGRRGSGSRPQCSHTHMDIVHGADLSCSVCNRKPTMGWLYCCQQDNMNHDSLYTKIPCSDQRILSPTTRNRKKLIKQKRRSSDLESYGFSPSVLAAAQKGHYTPAQLEVLKKQKLIINKLVQATNEEIKRLKSKHGPSADILTEKLAAIEDAQKRKGIDSESDRSQEKQNETLPARPVERMLQPCQFCVCHTCRPMSRDRTFISFESAFSSTVTPERLMYESRFMPIRNASLLREIGLKGPDEYYTRYLDEEDIWPEGLDPLSDLDISPDDRVVASVPQNVQVSLPVSNTSRQGPRGRGSSVGFRDSLKRAFHDMLRASQHGDSLANECLEAMTLDDVQRLNSSYEDKDSFDLDAWKRMADELLQRAASIGLPGADGEDDLDEVAEPGEEKHVRGGVALTEEAVELEVPDIITSV